MERTASKQSSTPATLKPEVEPILRRDLDVATRILGESFGDRITTLLLGGSFARGEGCVWRRMDEWVPGNNLNLYLLTRQALQPAELARARHRIFEEVRVESVVLTTLAVSRLHRLPATLDTLDLKTGHRLLQGDPSQADRIPSHDPARIPRAAAERRLRDRLVVLLEGYPRGRETYRSYYYSAKSIFASVDSLLLRGNRYTSGYRDKAHAFQSFTADENLLRLVERALEVKLGTEKPRDFTAERFWSAALRFHLDSLLALHGSPGSFRAERLRHLLAGFHYESTTWWRTARNLLRIFFHRNPRGKLERFLLALAMEKDPESFAIDLASYTDRRDLPAKPTWDDYLHIGIERWYGGCNDPRE